MLTLELVLDRESYPAGSPVAAAVTLRCLEAADRVVNTRLAANSRLAPAPFRDLYFDILGPSGAPVHFGARINVGFPTADDFRLLAAGETVVREYPLHRFFDLRRPGRYSIQAVYDSQSEPEDGRPAWTEAVRSQAVSFVVSDG